MSLDISLLKNHPQLLKFYEYETLLFNITEDNIEQLLKKIDEFKKEDYNCLRMYLSIVCTKFPFKLNLLAKVWCRMGDVHHHFTWTSPFIEYIAKRGIIKPYRVPQYVNPSMTWEDMERVFPVESIGHLIHRDDIDMFVARSEEPNFYSQKLHIFNTDSSLIAFAALCKSNQIFKFLLINDITGRKDDKKDIVKSAVIGGDSTIIELLVQYDFPFSDALLKTAFLYHNHDIAEWILTNYGDKNYGMIDMIQSFNVLAIAYGIENKLSLEKVDKDGHNLLISAACIGYEYVVQWIFEKHANFFDIEAKEALGFSALNYAAYAGNTSILNILIEHGADINSKTNENLTPILTACVVGQEDCVKALVEKAHASLLKTEDSFSPLILAAENGNPEVVEYLISLKPKININEADSFMETALYHAASHNFFSVVKLLVDNGADVNKQDLDGTTPLMTSIISYEDEDVLGEEEDFEEDAFDEEEQENEPQMRFSMSAMHNKTIKQKDEYFSETLSVISYLLDHNADMYLPQLGGENAFDMAISTGSLQIVQLFLKHGYNINHHNGLGATPLHVAVSNMMLKFVKMFIEIGSDINAQDEDGDTPLHVACLIPLITYAEYLIRCGADVNAENRKHVRPLNVAMRVRNEDLIQFLKEKGATISDNYIPMEEELEEEDL